MDFAKNLLSKYGWKEGDGLGKNNDGINIPLKAAYKFNKTGLGHNQADDMNNHWWEKVYNTASENVDVNKDDAGVVSMDLKSGESVEITTKDYSIHTKADKNFYKGHFLRTSTLVNSGKEIEVEDKDEVVFKSANLNPFKVVSDEDLLRACQGRTAHKGARHGLKLSGKLARIEEQERKLLAQMGIAYVAPPQNVVAEEWIQIKKRKNKNKEPIEPLLDIPIPEPKSITIEDTLQLADYHKKSKKAAKKQRKLDEEMAAALSSVTTNESVPEVTEDVKEKKKKKKSKSKAENDTDTPTNAPEECVVEKSSRKRRRNKIEGVADESDDANMTEKASKEVPETKRKKSSKKRKAQVYVVPATTFEAKHFKKSEGHLVEDAENERRTAKQLRKKERQLRRLAKQIDQKMCIV